jgi:hypothetical protein
MLQGLTRVQLLKPQMMTLTKMWMSMRNSVPYANRPSEEAIVNLSE